MILTGRSDRARVFNVWVKRTVSNTPLASNRKRLWILRQAVVELDPIYFLRDPNVFGRRERVAVIEGCERDAYCRAVFSPGKQPRAAFFAKHPVDRL